MIKHKLHLHFTAIILLISIHAFSQSCTFTNPLSTGGAADPHVIYKDGFYYGCFTTVNDITVWKSDKLKDIFTKQSAKVWSGKPDLWAPEIHYLNGKWYIYTTYNSGSFWMQTLVLEGNSQDPLGSYTQKAVLSGLGNTLDANVWLDSTDNQLYMTYSRLDGTSGEGQELWITKMSNPYTTEGHPKLISYPEHNWEKISGAVNEGPAFLIKGNKIHIVYSASQCHYEGYKLGLLTAEYGSDLLDKNSWTKCDTSLFEQYPAHDVYAVGHHSCVKTPTGEWWLIYHGKNNENKNTVDGLRDARMQPFTWNGDYPYFGIPVQVGTPINCPSADTILNCTKSPTPFTSISIPGIFEAEDFDINGYFDETEENTGGTYRADEAVDINKESGVTFVNELTSFEWLEYTVNVTNTDTFDINFYLATKNDVAEISILMDCHELVSGSSSRTLSYTDYRASTLTAILEEGTHTLRFQFDDPKDIRFDKVEVKEHSTNTSINHLKTERVFELSPNPASDQLLVKLPSTKNNLVSHLTIRDLQGRLVRSERMLLTETKTLNIEPLNPGVYFLTLKTNNFTVVKKFVKN